MKFLKTLLFSLILTCTFACTGQTISAINIGGSPNDKTGDPIRVAFQKVNSNFTGVATSISNLNSSVVYVHMSGEDISTNYSAYHKPYTFRLPHGVPSNMYGDPFAANYPAAGFDIASLAGTHYGNYVQLQFGANIESTNLLGASYNIDGNTTRFITLDYDPSGIVPNDIRFHQNVQMTGENIDMQGGIITNGIIDTSCILPSNIVTNYSVPVFGNLSDSSDIALIITNVGVEADIWFTGISNAIYQSYPLHIECDPDGFEVQFDTPGTNFYPGTVFNINPNGNCYMYGNVYAGYSEGTQFNPAGSFIGNGSGLYNIPASGVNNVVTNGQPKLGIGINPAVYTIDVGGFGMTAGSIGASKWGNNNIKIDNGSGAMYITAANGLFLDSLNGNSISVDVNDGTTNMSFIVGGKLLLGGVITGNGAGLTNLTIPTVYNPYKIINPVVSANFLIVSPAGNDSTAARNNATLPFASLTNAIVAAQANDIIYMYAGNYYIPYTGTILPAGLSIVGDTNGIVNIIIPAPGTGASAGFVLTNNITLANITIGMSNAASGYDTYPLYSGTFPLPFAGPSASITATITNIYLYNITIHGYSDCMYIKNLGVVTGTATKCVFTSRYDDINIFSGSLQSSFDFTFCSFTVVPLAPFRGYCPSRGVAGIGVTYYVTDSSFDIEDGSHTGIDTKYNVAFSVNATASTYPSSITARRNTYFLSSTNCISTIYSVYVPFTGSPNAGPNTFNTDLSSKVNGVITTYATVNWLTAGQIPPALIAATGATNGQFMVYNGTTWVSTNLTILPSILVATNSPVNGYALRYTNGSFYWAP